MGGPIARHSLALAAARNLHYRGPRGPLRAKCLIFFTVSESELVQLTIPSKPVAPGTLILYNLSNVRDCAVILCKMIVGRLSN